MINLIDLNPITAYYVRHLCKLLLQLRSMEPSSRYKYTYKTKYPAVFCFVIIFVSLYGLNIAIFLLYNRYYILMDKIEFSLCITLQMKMIKSFKYLLFSCTALVLPEVQLVS